MENNSLSHQSLDLRSIRCQLKELEEVYSNGDFDSEMLPPSQSDQILQDCALHLQSKAQQIISECSEFSLLGIEDLDAFVEQLKAELKATEAESAIISNEIEALTRNHVQDCTQLESDIELLKCSLDFMPSEDTRQEKEHDCREGLPSEDTLGDYEFEILKLDNQIEQSKILLKSLQDFDSMFKRVDAVEQIEEALSGLKVVEFDGTCIRLSVQTYLPKLDDLFCQHNTEDAAEPSEANHELLIVVNGTMEIKNVEMFPNDVYISDIVDAAKSFRKLFSQSALIETRSSLEWFVRKVQDRIVLCTLRRQAVKSANKSRHSFEYLDRDEMVVAHLVGGVDAFVKLCGGWPISRSPLKLISVKSSDHQSNQISLSLLCRVEEVANSLDINIRFNLSSFAEAIEKLLVEQMRIELHCDAGS